MNVLLLGSGGREHALAWKLRQSPRIASLYAAPGNPGIAKEAELLPLDIADHDGIIQAAKKRAIGLVVIGPEGPLAAGLTDDLRANGIAAFGPSRLAARLESSKAFTKNLCKQAGIPTADFEVFEDAGAALRYVRRAGAPVAVKADGLAAGKGVTVCASLAEAEAAIAECFAGAHGGAGSRVVIEDYLEGEEVSFFAICDGEAAIPFANAQDHKRAYDGDKGPNTGGMGAYSPAPVLPPAHTRQIMDMFIMPALREMSARNTPFRGVLYAGLMLTRGGPKLIEYNVRFGDPECQVLMLRLQSDLLPVLYASATGSLAGSVLDWDSRAAITVVMAAKGYPGVYERGGIIAGLEAAEQQPGVQVFQAGTARGQDGALRSAGGRVLNVCAVGENFRYARDKAYNAVKLIDWDGGFYRTDIGARIDATSG